jgi:PilZ domain
MRDDVPDLRAVWLAGYRRELEQARARGCVYELAPVAERRGQPRIRIHSRDVAAPGAGPLEVKDMSVTGLAFRSGRAYAPQRPLTLSLAHVFSAETDVLACERQDDRRDPPRYRVRCRFRDEAQGLQFLALTLELERLEQARAERPGAQPRPRCGPAPQRAAAPR